MVKQYLELSKDILGSTKSRFKFNERRGLGRIYLFGRQTRYDLSEGFPLLTTKRMPFKHIAHELIWFLSGNTNIKYLVDNGVHIWDDDTFNCNLKGMVKKGIFPEAFEKYSDSWIAARDEYIGRLKQDAEFAQRWGNAGPVYGAQWMHWPKFNPAGSVKIDGQETKIYTRDPRGINQIDEVLEGMRRDIKSARHMVTAWNPSEITEMALPPCHTLFQLNSDGEKLDIHLDQRACDMFLGVPFNTASYPLLGTIFAQELGLQIGDFVHTLTDVHFYTGAGERAKWYQNNFNEFNSRVRASSGPEDYSNVLAWLEKQLPPEDERKKGMDHVTGILEQLTREPTALPRVTIANKPYKTLTIDDFAIEGYNPAPTIKRTLAV
jgi:thymidylate synthase